MKSRVVNKGMLNEVLDSDLLYNSPWGTVAVNEVIVLYTETSVITLTRINLLGGVCDDCRSEELKKGLKVLRWEKIRYA